METIKVVVTGKNKIWFTSDQHFYHENILKFCSRPFENIEVMNKTIIDNWNEVVGKDDVVFTLGDFVWWNDPIKIKDIVSQLNGKTIVFIMGNHDKIDSFKHLLKTCNNVKLIQSDIVHLKIKYQELSNASSVELVLSHYPLMSWSGRNRNCINLHGHIHSGPDNKDGFDKDLPIWKGMQMDVGVDNNNYKPVDLQTILFKMENETPICDSEEKETNTTKIYMNDNGHTVSLKMRTIVPGIEGPINSLYEFTYDNLKEFGSLPMYPMRPIIDILKDHKNNIIEHNGPWIENIVSNEQIDQLKEFFNKYKKVPK